MSTQQKPITTLYMLMSLDGKISTGSSDELDFDKDLPKIDGVKDGLHQYYDIEKTTDVVSFNTGRVMAKIGVNERTDKPSKMPVTFVIVDKKPHLTENGVKYLIDWTQKLILVTTNDSHPALSIQNDTLQVVQYDKEVDFNDLFNRLSNEFEVEQMTIQSGGEMNANLIREGLVDYISVVVAPIIVGGRDTSTLVDGESLTKLSELNKLRPLELVSYKQLDESYLHLQYKVLN